MRFIPNSVSSKLALTALKVSKTSPRLLFVGGVVGVVGTVILSSRATLQLPSILDEVEDKKAKYDEGVHKYDNYSAEDAVKDKALLYFKTSVRIVKLYAPSLALAAVSIGMLTGSHHILSKRNAALTAAYATLEKSFRGYRDRVVKDVGEDKDREYRYGVETDEVTETDENGKKTQVKKKVATATTEYGKLFRQGNVNWRKEPDYNLLFIRGVQRYANDSLQAKGYLFLNDVYDQLGIDRTSAGQIVGWLADNSGKYGNNDGYVDFGLFSDHDALRIHDYVTGREGELYLDFNVDGPIYDKI